MIQREFARELFAYNDWGHRAVLASAAGLPDAALDQRFEMGQGSLRATLTHTWSAERIWLDRWKGIVPARFDFPPPETLERIDRALAELAAERDDFLAHLTDANIAKSIAYESTDSVRHEFPLGAMLLHLGNHGTHTRAQALNMLRRLGATIPKPGCDYIFMKLAQQSAGPPTAPPALDRASLQSFYAYGDWAQLRALKLASDLGDEQLDRPFEMGLGSIRATLAHIRFAEQWWFENWTLGPGRPFPETDPSIGVEKLTALFQKTAAARDEFLKSRTDADLAAIVRAVPRPGVERAFPLSVTMMQLCNHGTHHRAQAINMLRHVGASVPGFDVLVMVREGRAACQ